MKSPFKIALPREQDNQRSRRPYLYSAFQGASLSRIHQWLSDFRVALPFIAWGALAGVAVAFILLLVAQPTTRASLLIAPAEKIDDSSASLIGKDKNLALLNLFAQRAGVGTYSQFQYFQSLYKSPEVAAILLKNPQIKTMIALDRRFRFLPGTAIQTPAQMAYYIDKHVTLRPQNLSLVHSMEYWHPDPAFAVYFLSQIHHIADHIIREKAQSRATQRSAYLRYKLDEVKNPDHRKVLAQLLEEQERALMLSAIDQPFSAQTIQKSSAFYKPEWPNKSVWIVLFFLLGAGAGYLFYNLRHLYRDG